MCLRELIGWQGTAPAPTAEVSVDVNEESGSDAVNDGEREKHSTDYSNAMARQV